MKRTKKVKLIPNTNTSTSFQPWDFNRQEFAIPPSQNAIPKKRRLSTNETGSKMNGVQRSEESSTSQSSSSSSTNNNITQLYTATHPVPSYGYGSCNPHMECPGAMNYQQNCQVWCHMDPHYPMFGNETTPVQNHKPIESGSIGSLSGVNWNCDKNTARATEACEELFLCNSCGKIFFHLDNWSAHILAEHKSPYRCDQCKKEYKQLHALTEHRRSHSVHIRFTCLMCSQNFSGQDEWFDHMRLFLDHRCSVCGKPSVAKRMLAVHEKCGNRKTTFVCDDCKDLFVALHWNIHPIEKSFVFDCVACSLLIVHRSTLEKVKTGSSNSSNKQMNIQPSTIFCILCNTHFANSSALGTHDCACLKAIVECETNENSAVEVRELRSSSSNEVDYSSVIGPSAEPIPSQQIQPQQMKVMEGGDDDSPVISTQFSCTKCSKTFIDIRQWRSHVKQHPPPYKCDVCLKLFKTKHGFKDHRYTHTGERPLKCTRCTETFTWHTQLMRHMDEHLGFHRCYVCNGRFQSTEELDAHKPTHNGEKKYACQACGKLFAKRFRWQEHMNSVHPEVHKCEQCHQQFENRQTLVKHIRTICEVEPRPDNNRACHVMCHRCSTCGKCFPSSGDLDVHECPTNDDSALPSALLCDICGRSFKWTSNYREHMNMHSAKYECHLCRKYFPSAYYLKRHAYSHISEKPHKCLECGKSFIRKVQLADHMDMHAGVKYDCSVCRRQFGNKSVLLKHVSMCHKVGGRKIIRFPMALGGNNNNNNNEEQQRSSDSVGWTLMNLK